MAEKIFINELKPKDNVDTTFLVKYLSVMMGKDGKNYLNVILSDKNGDLEARKWHGAETVIASINKGDFVHVSGKVNLYQGRTQFIISEMYKVDQSKIVLDDYIMKSATAPQKMFDELAEIISKMREIYLKDLIEAIIFDQEVRTKLLTWSAGKSVHHSYSGGLLEHLLSCVKLGGMLAKFYKVNESYVVAGAVLHDLAKIFELSDGPMVEYTDEGKLVGHLVKAIEIVDHFAERLPEFPKDQLMHLKHILVSHHGEYSFGSSKLPQTSEAMLVHMIDLIDSKMNSFETAIKSDNSYGNWTGYIKHLDRVIFKNELPTYTGQYHSTDAGEKEPAPDAPNVSKKNERHEKLGPMAKLLKDVKLE